MCGWRGEFCFIFSNRKKVPSLRSTSCKLHPSRLLNQSIPDDHPDRGADAERTAPRGPAQPPDLPHVDNAQHHAAEDQGAHGAAVVARPERRKRDADAQISCAEEQHRRRHGRGVGFFAILRRQPRRSSSGGGDGLGCLRRAAGRRRWVETEALRGQDGGCERECPQAHVGDGHGEAEDPPCRGGEIHDCLFIYAGEH